MRGGDIAGEWRQDMAVSRRGKGELRQSQRWSQNVTDTEEEVSEEEGWEEREGGRGRDAKLSQSPRAPPVSL